jgi:hypothetical protein
VDFCVECGERKGKNKKLYESALCKQLRCENHLIWVPSHLIDHNPLDVANDLKKILKGAEQNGWYMFCGRLGHIPRGVSYWYGEDRQNGKLVEHVGDHQKLAGYEFYNYWQVGIVEDGVEKRWQPSHFEPSCEFSLSLRLIHRFVNEPDQNAIVQRIWNKVVNIVTTKRKTFFPTSEDVFLKFLKGKEPLLGIAQYFCSRCATVACLNRLSPFHDKKILKEFRLNPEYSR